MPSQEPEFIRAIGSTVWRTVGGHTRALKITRVTPTRVTCSDRKGYLLAEGSTTGRQVGDSCGPQITTVDQSARILEEEAERTRKGAIKAVYDIRFEHLTLEQLNEILKISGKFPPPVPSKESVSSIDPIRYQTP